MKSAIFTILFIGGVLSGCCCSKYEVSLDRSPEAKPGDYLLHYRKGNFIEHYIPQDFIKGNPCAHEPQPHSEECEAILNKIYTSAVNKCLKENNLMPPECTNGIIVTGHNAYEGGMGISFFRCK